MCVLQELRQNRFEPRAREMFATQRVLFGPFTWVMNTLVMEHGVANKVVLHLAQLVVFTEGKTGFLGPDHLFTILSVDVIADDAEAAIALMNQRCGTHAVAGNEQNAALTHIEPGRMLG